MLRGRSGGYPTDIRAAYDTGGNYVVQGADVALSIRAMESLEFSVCHDLFLTTTARYCDVVLPATHWLERSDIVFTSADYLLYSHRVAAPPGLARHDYDIFADLAEASGCGDAYTEGRDAEGVAAPLPGGFRGRPTRRSSGAAASTGAPTASASGSPTSPPTPSDPLSRPLRDGSSSRRRLCLRRPVDDAGGAGAARSPERPLYFISPKSRLRVHTQFADIPWIRERDDRTLWIHPADASARGIVGDDEVVVASDRGSVRCFCRVTEGVMEGVVSLLAGIEPRFAEDGCDTAGSANVLTSPEPTLPSRGARLLSTLVEVRRAGPQAGSGVPSARPVPG